MCLCGAVELALIPRRDDVSLLGFARTCVGPKELASEHIHLPLGRPRIPSRLLRKLHVLSLRSESHSLLTQSSKGDFHHTSFVNDPVLGCMSGATTPTPLSLV